MSKALALPIEIPTDPNDRAYRGAAMQRLSARQRTFVISMLQQGINPKASRQAAVSAGYSADHSSRLMSDPDILAALKEEATKRLAGAA